MLFLLLGSLPPDLDLDGLPDAVEQELLDRFVPRFYASAEDCDLMPAEFEPGVAVPRVKARNGTIYGQAFPVGEEIELHFYHLWARDCGQKPHDLDAEHVSVLLHKQGGEWRARYWLAAAHQETICDVSMAARAGLVYAEWRGPEVWISKGKHASFFSREACQSGCGGDRCERTRMLAPGRVINLGEPDAPLQGAIWTGFLKAKMGTDFGPELRQLLEESDRAVVVKPSTPAVKPVIAAGSSTVSAVGTSVKTTKSAVKRWFERRF